MATSTYYLASGSYKLKVWDFENKTIDKNKLKFTTNTLNYPISCLSWNHTNQVVAVAGSKGSVTLYQANNGHILAKVPFPEIKDPFYENNVLKSVSFSSNSRYLACGLPSAVHVWDLKKRVLKFTSTNKVINGQVNSLLFLNEDSVISGDSSGYIRIWDTTNTTAEYPKVELNYENYLSVTCMELLYLSQTNVTNGYSDGKLCLWDVTTSNNLRSQKVHDNTLTGVSCSARNSRLISSVGLDGKLALVDINEKPVGSSTSAAVETNESLHCVSFHENGINCAVGGSSGNIYIYDWRNIKSPVVTIEAHNNDSGDHSVLALKFQIPSISKANSSKSPATNDNSKLPTKNQLSLSKSSATTDFKKSSSIDRSVNTISNSNEKLISSDNQNSDQVAAKSNDIKSVLDNVSKSKIQVPSPRNNSAKRNLLSSISNIDNEKQNEGKYNINQNNSKSILSNSASNNSLSSVESIQSIDGNIPFQSSKPSSGEIATALDIRNKNAIADIIPNSKESDNFPNPTESDSFPNLPNPKESDSVPNLPNPKETDTQLNPMELDSLKGTLPSPKESDSFNVAIKEKYKYSIPEKIQKPSNNNEPNVLINNNHKELYDNSTGSDRLTRQELEESLLLLRFDFHKEIQNIIKEQAKKFELAKEETNAIINQLSKQMKELLDANRELRLENEKLRKIY